MVKITKQEAKYLRTNHQGWNVHMSSQTHQDRKKYWLTETPAALKMLSKFRREHVTLIYGGDTK